MVEECYKELLKDKDVSSYLNDEQAMHYCSCAVQKLYENGMTFGELNNIDDEDENAFNEIALPCMLEAMEIGSDSDFYDYYTNPKITQIDEPKNLVFIYAESLEGTYLNDEKFPGLTVGLNKIKSKSIYFDNIETLYMTLVFYLYSIFYSNRIYFLPLLFLSFNFLLFFLPFFLSLSLTISASRAFLYFS